MKLYSPPSALSPSAQTLALRSRIARRHRFDRWFRRGGLCMVLLCLLMLCLLIGRLVFQGQGVLLREEMALTIDFSPTNLSLTTPTPTETDLRQVDGDALWRSALLQKLSMENVDRTTRRTLYGLVSAGAGATISQELLGNPALIGTQQTIYLPLSSSVGQLIGNTWNEQVKERSYESPLSLVYDGKTVEMTVEQPLIAAHIPARSQWKEGIAELSPETESVFMSMKGGIVKVTHMAANMARGDVIIPFKETPTVGLTTVHSWKVATFRPPESERQMKDLTFSALYALKEQKVIATHFNTRFFTHADSRDPEMAGIWGAIVGSFLTLLICFSLSFPVGVAAAIYLEEFSAESRLKRLLEVNINNLAAVPAIIYGLLGVALFLNLFGLPRSAPLVGGLVLSFKVLPVIIISTRSALKAVPLSIRQAAWALGASPMQTVFHHVVPLALPGIMTGTILGLSQALGETAPLLMIGMVAFVADIPAWFTDAASVLPVQIYIWADSPEQGFREKTAAAILVLLVFMMLMNAVAIYIRKRFERRW